jgi:hypothetical protein
LDQFKKWSSFFLSIFLETCVDCFVGFVILDFDFECFDTLAGSAVGPNLGTCTSWDWEQCPDPEPTYTAVRILLFILVILAVLACFGTF